VGEVQCCLFVCNCARCLFVVSCDLSSMCSGSVVEGE